MEIGKKDYIANCYEIEDVVNEEYTKVLEIISCVFKDNRSDWFWVIGRQPLIFSGIFKTKQEAIDDLKKQYDKIACKSLASYFRKLKDTSKSFCPDSKKGFCVTSCVALTTKDKKKYCKKYKNYIHGVKDD